jgi:hypothetical protein
MLRIFTKKQILYMVVNFMESVLSILAYDSCSVVKTLHDFSFLHEVDRIQTAAGMDWFSINFGC